MQKNNIHQGHKVKEIILSSGLSHKAVAQKLNISRSTLYSRLSESKLPSEFMLSLGRLLNYDFSNVFPELKPVTNQLQERFITTQHEYISTLERCITIMNLLVEGYLNSTDSKLRDEIGKALAETIQKLKEPLAGASKRYDL